jgi:hypothetical protein
VSEGTGCVRRVSVQLIPLQIATHKSSVTRSAQGGRSHRRSCLPKMMARSGSGSLFAAGCCKKGQEGEGAIERERGSEGARERREREREGWSCDQTWAPSQGQRCEQKGTHQKDGHPRNRARPFWAGHPAP